MLINWLSSCNRLDTCLIQMNNYGYLEHTIFIGNILKNINSVLYRWLHAQVGRKRFQWPSDIVSETTTGIIRGQHGYSLPSSFSALSYRAMGHRWGMILSDLASEPMVFFIWLLIGSILLPLLQLTHSPASWTEGCCKGFSQGFHDRSYRKNS